MHKFLSNCRAWFYEALKDSIGNGVIFSPGHCVLSSLLMGDINIFCSGRLWGKILLQTNLRYRGFVMIVLLLDAGNRKILRVGMGT